MFCCLVFVNLFTQFLISTYLGIRLQNSRVPPCGGLCGPSIFFPVHYGRGHAHLFLQFDVLYVHEYLSFFLVLKLFMFAY